MDEAVEEKRELEKELECQRWVPIDTCVTLILIIFIIIIILLLTTHTKTDMQLYLTLIQHIGLSELLSLLFLGLKLVNIECVFRRVALIASTLEL